MSRNNRFNRGKERARKGSSLAEFPVALALFIPVLIGLISLASAGLAMVTVQLVCEMAAHDAARTITFAQAKKRVARFDQDILDRFIGSLVKKENCDPSLLELSVVKQEGGTSEGKSTNTITIYRVAAHYRLSPLLFPAALTVRSDACAVAEHPEGL